MTGGGILAWTLSSGMQLISAHGQASAGACREGVQHGRFLTGAARMGARIKRDPDHRIWRMHHGEGAAGRALGAVLWMTWGISGRSYLPMRTMIWDATVANAGESERSPAR